MLKKGKVLVVDDNAGIRKALDMLLPLHFGEVKTIPSPVQLVSTIGTFRPDVILLDMNFNTDINTGNEGLYWINEIKRIAPDIEVVLFTAYADVQLAVEGMKRGAFDFIVKPWDNDKLVTVLKAALDKSRKVVRPSATTGKDMYWGESPRMLEIKHQLEKIAPTDATVLITGENGTGKDVLAREIHAASLRNGKPMVAVDAGAITETLFESELFGHVKGAFTDAHTDHAGKFEQANGSTLFMDEIGNIPLHLQAKLLRAIQNRDIVRVGGTTPIPVDIRLICATKPPLRERRDDIIPLAMRFLNRYAEKYHRPLQGIDAAAQGALTTHSWSGNIRELQNCIEKAVILSDGSMIGRDDIGFETSQALAGKLHETMPDGYDEERLVRDAMTRCRGNISAAAKMMGVSRPTFYAKLKKYGL